MNGNIDFHIPDCNQFRNGYEAYTRERRGAVYFEALSLISENWGDPVLMAQGVQRLIRSWHRFFANFDFDSLVNCIDNNFQDLNEFRARNVVSLADADDVRIESLFNHFLDALKRTRDNAKSPVSVAKALSPLATHFFPLWDSNIAFSYNCFYLADISAPPYIRFCKKMKIMSEHVQHCVSNKDDRSLLKRIDEYNYSKYTMHWI